MCKNQTISTDSDTVANRNSSSSVKVGSVNDYAIATYFYLTFSLCIPPTNTSLSIIVLSPMEIDLNAFINARSLITVFSPIVTTPSEKSLQSVMLVLDFITTFFAVICTSVNFDPPSILTLPDLIWEFFMSAFLEIFILGSLYFIFIILVKSIPLLTLTSSCEVRYSKIFPYILPPFICNTLSCQITVIMLKSPPNILL